ncbi:MAG TPA: glycoside hydrolase family 15 protein [Candidatus Acidoferrum sp.]|nr:glycoside hydrolase family 15 protein [Candidatus Acidoferrum sp.]
MTKVIKHLIENSKQVIRDCVLENGSIVAANGSKDYFPKEAKYYTYVWPRDASFTCVAADILGIEIQERFFDWCIERAEGFQDSGLFYEKYFVNGLKALKRFQPDQTGSVLWAVWYHFKDDLKKAAKYKSLIDKAANGICEKWDNDHFVLVTNDLWEERLTFPDLKDNFTYSLAACIKGLECANAITPCRRWDEVAGEMRERLESHFEDYFFRSYGNLSDKRIDASLIGLAYPFEVFSFDDERMVATIREIEAKIVMDGGIHRYENDDYDGWMFEDMQRNKGSGAWPLLNFWMSIYYSKAGDKAKALKYYDWVIEKVNDFIPEQIFSNGYQISVKPLCWSHSMFVMASKELGYI